ncbi:hypothetical protein AB0J86_22425 [Micromonospora sp. NPDC049559]|uniref:hypothetical protein n=1 Tax=Micromonospora sp. NPDC049559 TaxID=3155923 RepID=UPI00341B8579
MVLVVNKGYRDAKTEALLAGRNTTMLRTARKAEKSDPAEDRSAPGRGPRRAPRQAIESVDGTLKRQVDL